MAKAVPMIRGQRFGRLTLTRLSEKRSGREYCYECLCDCGATHVASGSQLRSGNTKSCGCLHREMARAQAATARDGIAPSVKVGEKYWRVLIEAVDGKRGGHVYYVCLCDCGKRFTARGSHVKDGGIRSCGCLLLEKVTTHGMGKADDRRSPEYYTWASMIQRCVNPKQRSFANYGGRGITVCDEWKNSFEAFYAYIGPRPSPKHSIDRFPNNDGNYEPGNVRWATRVEQQANKRPRKRKVQSAE